MNIILSYRKDGVKSDTLPRNTLYNLELLVTRSGAKFSTEEIRVSSPPEITQRNVYLFWLKS